MASTPPKVGWSFKFEQMAFYSGGLGSKRSYNRTARTRNTRPLVPISGLKSYFNYVDKDRSGKIDAEELKNALTNGSWKPFNLETCKLMIAMFDKNGSGRIEFSEFADLWKYICDWTDCFQEVDRDGSGFIDKPELVRALNDFGYRLSDDFIDMLIQKFTHYPHVGRIYADSFIQMCITLQTVTAAFAAKDEDRDGVITVQYEEFLRMIFFFKMTLMSQTSPPSRNPTFPNNTTPNYQQEPPGPSVHPC